MHRFITGFLLISSLAGTAAAQELVSFGRQDGKTVQARVYQPSGACSGVAVISPGAGGTQNGYRYLGELMGAQHYLALVVDHQESDYSAVAPRVRRDGLRRGLSEVVTDPAAYRGRMQDIAAARQWGVRHCPSSTFNVLLGHSMGAATVMIEAGAKNRVEATGRDEFDAYVALSPQGVGQIFPSDAWSGIRKPVLSITGTRDQGLDGNWSTRLQPFEDMPPGCKWQAVIDGATHMDFGRGGSKRVEELTTKTITAFLEGVRTGHCAALPAAERGMQLRAK